MCGFDICGSDCIGDDVISEILESLKALLLQTCILCNKGTRLAESYNDRKFQLIRMLSY